MRVRASLSLWLLAGCGGALQPSTIPLDKDFQCRIRIAGQELLVLLDTGAEASSFYSDAAKRLGLPVGPMDDKVVQVTDSSGVEREHRDFAKDVSFKLGELNCTGDGFLCLPRAARPRDTRSNITIARAAAHDGILGMDLLGKTVLWFDAPKQQLHVLSHDTVEAFLAQRGRKIALRLPLSGGNRPHVQVSLQDVLKAELLLDTGADHTSLPAGAAAQLELPSGSELERKRRERKGAEIAKALDTAGLEVTKIEVNEADGSSVGVHGVPSAPRPVHHLRSLRLGAREVRDLVVAEDEHPLLGRDVLATFEWILHGPRRELWFLTPK